MPAQIGKILIFIGSWLIILGLIFLILQKVPYIGKLPGDILIKKKNFTFYFPLSTCIIISLVFSLILWIILHKK